MPPPYWTVVPATNSHALAHPYNKWKATVCDSHYYLLTYDYWWEWQGCFLCKLTNVYTYRTSYMLSSHLIFATKQFCFEDDNKATFVRREDIRYLKLRVIFIQLWYIFFLFFCMQEIKKWFHNKNEHKTTNIFTTWCIFFA